jgi:hypothetical protein
MAQQFMRTQLTAGRTADQIAATHDYITGPWRGAGHHSAARAATYQGCTELIGPQLAQRREADPAAEPGADRPFEHTPQAEMEVGQ